MKPLIVCMYIVHYDVLTKNYKSPFPIQFSDEIGLQIGSLIHFRTLEGFLVHYDLAYYQKILMIFAFYVVTFKES